MSRLQNLHFHQTDARFRVSKLSGTKTGARILLMFSDEVNIHVQ
jgi:hypothetical protein